MRELAAFTLGLFVGALLTAILIASWLADVVLSDKEGK